MFSLFYQFYSRILLSFYVYIAVTLNNSQSNCTYWQLKSPDNARIKELYD